MSEITPVDFTFCLIFTLQTLIDIIIMYIQVWQRKSLLRTSNSSIIVLKTKNLKEVNLTTVSKNAFISGFLGSFQTPKPDRPSYNT